jgi:hypothetical protein
MCVVSAGETMNKARNKSQIIKQLQVIPGVGPSIANDLYEMGITSVRQLKGKDPEKLYRKRCEQQAVLIDRCLLYVFRCAVYFASTKRPRPELLLWWNWKDRSITPGKTFERDGHTNGGSPQRQRTKPKNRRDALLIAKTTFNGSR